MTIEALLDAMREADEDRRLHAENRSLNDG